MIVVEILGRGGRVVERVRLAQLPATIGRGYGCDVILDDPYADAVHARLAQGEDGTLVAEDLGSANGLCADERGPRLDRLVLRSGATFRVGHTTLRVATAESAVAPARRDPRLGSRARRLVHGRLTPLLLTVVGSPLFGAAFYLGAIDKPGAGQFVIGVVSGLAFVAAWAGSWALATRIRSGQARFLAHLSVAWLGFAALMALALVESWTRFLTADSAFADVLGVATAVLGGTALLYGHLAIASELGRARRLATGLTVTTLLLLLALVLERSGSEAERYDITIGMPLKPLAARWIPSQTPTAFLDGVVELQRAVDAEAGPP